MKKIKFLNGIRAMFAVAAIVSAGSLFTACEQEEFTATFEPGPAEVTLNVTVLEPLEGVVTENATIEVSGKLTQTGTTSFESGYAGGNVTVKATYNGATAEETISTNALKKGGAATYNVTLVVSAGEVVVTSTTVTGTPVESSLLAPTHDHAGKSWWENASEYILITDITYPLYNEQEIVKIEVSDKVDVSNFVSNLAFNYTEEATLTITVSAWALYRAWTTYIPSTTTYKFSYKDSGEDLGYIEVAAKRSTIAQPEEVAHPSHAGHYHYGHGHGYSENAGGGIISFD